MRKVYEDFGFLTGLGMTKLIRFRHIKRTGEGISMFCEGSAEMKK